jgi:hypothetical protein
VGKIIQDTKLTDQNKDWTTRSAGYRNGQVWRWGASTTFCVRDLLIESKGHAYMRAQVQPCGLGIPGRRALPIAAPPRLNEGALSVGRAGGKGFRPRRLWRSSDLDQGRYGHEKGARPARWTHPRLG